MQATKAEQRTLTCDMTRDCTSPVSHIDVKGYVYCAVHGAQRKQSVRARKLTPGNLAQLRAGLPIRY